MNSILIKQRKLSFLGKRADTMIKNSIQSKHKKSNSI